MQTVLQPQRSRLVRAKIVQRAARPRINWRMILALGLTFAAWAGLLSAAALLPGAVAFAILALG